MIVFITIIIMTSTCNPLKQGYPLPNFIPLCSKPLDLPLKVNPMMMISYNPLLACIYNLHPHPCSDPSLHHLRHYMRDLARGANNVKMSSFCCRLTKVWLTIPFHYNIWSYFGQHWIIFWSTLYHNLVKIWSYFVHQMITFGSIFDHILIYALKSYFATVWQKFGGWQTSLH